MSAISIERYKEMATVQKAIRTEYKLFKSWYCKHDLSFCISMKEEFPFQLLKKRICGRKQRSLKAYFSFSIFKFLLIKDKGLKVNDKSLFSRKIPFIAELLMTIQYYDNQILDRKGGVVSDQAIINNFKLSKLLRAALHDYLDDENIFELKTGKILKKWVFTILKQVDYGQLLEKNNNLFINYKTDLYGIGSNNTNDYNIEKCLEKCKKQILEIAPELKEKDQFLTKYLDRVFWAGASMYPALVELILELLNIKGRDVFDNLYHFSGVLGITLQLVNDNTDNVTRKAFPRTVAKKSEDAFSDIRNQNITLPLLIHLQKNSGKYIEESIQSGVPLFSLRQEKLIFKELLDSGALLASKEITKQLAHLTESILSEMVSENWEKKPYINLTLGNICGIAYYNNAYGFIEKSAKARVRRLDEMDKLKTNFVKKQPMLGKARKLIFERSRRARRLLAAIQNIAISQKQSTTPKQRPTYLLIEPLNKIEKKVLTEEPEYGFA